MEKELRIYLIELARVRRKVGYAKAMERFGLDVSKPVEVYAFADQIGEISEYENIAGRPMLSSLVVHSHMKTIGYGFYGLAEKLGYGEKEHLHKIRFEIEMQERCYATWSDDELYYQHTNRKRPSEPIIDYSLYPNDMPPDGYEELPKRGFDFEGYDTDWNQKHLFNMECGKVGEDLVLEYEQRVLKDNGFPELAAQVRKAKDGNGYDILSKNFDGSHKYIEVKTTTLDQKTPFIISINEIKFSEMNSQNYHLYRLYNLNLQERTAEFNEYTGNMSKHFYLDCTQFEAFPKKKREA